MNLRPCLLVALLTVSGTALAAPQAQESLVELLPARAKVAVIVRRNAIAPLRDLVFNNPDMMKELSPYLERTLGLDVTRLEGIVVYTADLDKPEQHIGMVLRIPSGGTALKLPEAGDAGGTPMYRVDKDIVCARTRTGLVLGNEAEVRSLVAVERGKEPALARDSGLGKLLSAEANEIDFVLAVGPGLVPKDKVMGVEDALLVYRRSGLIELALHGDPNQLAGLAGVVNGGMQVGMSQLAQEKDTATATNDPVKGATMIMTYYQAKRVVAEIAPKVEGNALKMRYKLPDMAAGGSSSMVLAMLGAGSAVAIPAFQKYIKRSKTVEATMNVRKLADSVVAVAESSKKASSIKGTEWTPKVGCCGQPGNKCAPDAKNWSGPTWKALNFSVDDPSYYQYRVRVDGKGNQMKIVVEARGDLDCDKEFSSFRRTVNFSSGSPVIETLQSDNDTE